MNQKERGNQILKQQLEFYKDRDMEVHILKCDGRVCGGKILEIAGDMIIIEDIKLGSMPVYFSQINVVEKFKK